MASPGRKPTNRYHHGDLRNAALAEAIRYVERSGPESLTLRALAARLRVTSTALYRHYASKRDLLAAIAANGFATLMEAHQKSELEHRDQPGAWLFAVGIDYVRFALQHPAQFRLMFGDELRDCAELSELAGVKRASYDAMGRAIRACAEHNLLGDTPAEEVQLAAWASAHGTAMLLLDGQIITAAQQRLSEEMLLDHARRILAAHGKGMLRPHRAA